MVRQMLSTYSESPNRSAKLSSPTKVSDNPKGSVRVKLDHTASPAGNRKNTTVRASCGSTRPTGSSQPGKMVRRMA